jgi:glucokinase
VVVQGGSARLTKLYWARSRAGGRAASRPRRAGDRARRDNGVPAAAPLLEYWRKTRVYSVGIDIGGTKIAGALVDDAGTVVREARTPTPAADAAALEDAVFAMVTAFAAEGPVIATGVAAAGFVKADGSEIYYAPNVAWRHEPLQGNLSARLGHPVVVENDANAAGWGEYVLGAGRGRQSMLMATIGTGIGGAFVSEGRLFRGGFGAGAEVGHLMFRPGGILCGCGSRGCIEQYASGRALLRLANEVADAGGVGAELAALRAARGALTGTDVSDLLQAGDRGAVHALTLLGRNLGEALASMQALYDPELIVLGGGVAQAGELLLEPVRAAFFEHLSARDFRPHPDFAIAELVNDAGVIGAADLARRALRG